RRRRPAPPPALETDREGRTVPPRLVVHGHLRGDSRLPRPVAHPRRVSPPATRLRHPAALARLALDLGVRLHRPRLHRDGSALRLPEQLVLPGTRHEGSHHLPTRSDSVHV